MRKFLSAALISGLAWPMPSMARETLRLKPTTKWLLNYADDSCRLARKFGESDQQVTLFLDQLEPGDWFQIVLGGKPVKPEQRDQARVDVTLRFGPSEATLGSDAYTGTMNGMPALLVSGAHRLVPLTEAETAARKASYEGGPDFVIPSLSPEQERAVTFLELSEGAESDLILETGPMDQPLKALRDCAWDTIRSWGLDVEQQRTLSRKVSNRDPLKPWFRADDYPMKMLRGGYEGVVNFRLLVDSTGKPTSCRIQTSTRPKEFDDAVCRGAMSRARFNPALDAQGNPVPSYFRSTVNFRLGGSPSRLKSR